MKASVSALNVIDSHALSPNENASAKSNIWVAKVGVLLYLPLYLAKG